ncbi:MAG: DUF4340 domain-containing protein, partial [Clostridiales bacterium]|nr:DUF4340 domain-containing protein [Clostridiales bacterium]
MKKQHKQFIAICVILVVVIAGYFGAVAYNNAVTAREEAEEEANTVYYAQLDLDDIVAFSYTLDDDVLSFELVDDEWVYTDDTSIDIDEDEIEDMIDVMEEIVAADVVEADEYDSDSLADFGLDEPVFTLNVTLSDGTEIEFTEGDKNQVVGYYYYLRSDDARIFMWGSTLDASFT